MPTDTIIAMIPVVLLFVFFAGTMIWADLYSNKK
jgi:uncharacterized membrane protein